MTESDNVLVRWYDNRIGEAATADEVRGYWLFVAGVVLGLAGIGLFFLTETATESRGLAYGLAALAPPFVMLGAVIRFPLRKAATSLGYGGAVLSSLAVVWFMSVFPGGWSTAVGNMGIIGLYGVGIIAIALAGVFIPLLTEPLMTPSQRAAADAATAASEADLAAAREQAADLEAEVQDREVEIDELKAEVEQLQTAAAADRDSSARFELFTDRSDKFRWRLRHRNGNIIADSSQGYTALHNAQKGLQSVRRNALGAGVLRIESEPEADSDPVPDDADEPVVAVPEVVAERDSQAIFEQFTDTGGDHRWRLRHDNGNILADSSEGYSSKSKAATAIDRVKAYVGPADYLWFDPAGFEVYRDAADKWRWRLVHRNGNILADSGEGYSRRHDAARAVDRLRNDLDSLSFNVYEDTGGEFRWRLQSDNGQIVADSGEGYASRDGANEAVERVQNYAADADTLEIGRAAFEIYEDTGGEFRWRLRHRNGNILADSGEGYADRSGARDGIESVKRNAPSADAEQAD